MQPSGSRRKPFWRRYGLWSRRVSVWKNLTNLCLTPFFLIFAALLMIGLLARNLVMELYYLVYPRAVERAPWERRDRAISEQEFWTYVIRRCRKKKVTIEQIEDELPSPSAIPADWLTEWQEFRRQLAAGDVIWYFRSNEATWKRLAGRSGYVVLRNGEFVTGIVTRLN